MHSYDPSPFIEMSLGGFWLLLVSDGLVWTMLFSTIPKCQDTKRAIGIYEALNDKKGEAGYLQIFFSTWLWRFSICFSYVFFFGLQVLVNSAFSRSFHDGLPENHGPL